MNQAFKSLGLALLINAASSASINAGQDSHRDGLVDTIEALMQEGHFPGAAIAVTRNGEPIHISVHGMADISSQTAVTTQTVFEIASLTKQMTALAIMTLVSDGELSLSDKLGKFIEDIPEDWAGISIRQLLAHTAGLEHRFERTVDGVFLLEYTREDMLASAMATPMVAEPGTDWHYSDQGYFLLGIVIEQVSGRPFAEFMEETFFGPLGMTQTHLLDQRRIVPDAAQGYALHDGKLERNRRVWQFELTSHFGVMSSLDDMMLWERELSDPRVIDAAAIEATWEINRSFSTGASCDTWGYASGWQAVVRDGMRVLTHGGYAGTAYIRAVDAGLSVIVLTNREDTAESLSPFALAWATAHAMDNSLPRDGYRCWE
ncbi:MAG: serine hydrolase domain-containing protein [Planctomycetota bacterium]